MFVWNLPQGRRLFLRRRGSGTKFNRRIKTMGSTMDKVKGMANEAAGNVKQAAGKALDKPELEAEGFAQERKGEAQQALGKGKDAIKKVVDKA
jgi:uncharacterized protein YjbJ (UPF0337 family)